MEENKMKKISISTVLLIIAIIAIFIMGVFIYKLNNAKIAEVQKSTELQAEVNSLNESLNELQGKIDTISKTINSKDSNNTEINNNITNNTNQVVKIDVGSFLVKDITDEERNDGVIGWINVLENNKFDIPRARRDI